MKYCPVFVILIVVSLHGVARSQITGASDEFRTVPFSTSQATSLSKAGDTKSKATLPSIRDFTNNVVHQLKNEAKAKSISDQVDQTLRLVESANHLKSDPRVASNASLQSLRTRLLQRLRKVEKRTLAAERRRKRRPESIEIKQEVLAQLNQAVNGVNGAGAQNANAGLPDYGPMLVELIQRTISPQSWDVNGGASTIRYWKPGMALVVRAPAGVHSDLGPILGQLRQQ